MIIFRDFRFVKYGSAHCEKAIFSPRSVTGLGANKIFIVDS